MSLTLLKTISTTSITVPLLSNSQLACLDAWLRSILWDAKLPRAEKYCSFTQHQEDNSFEIHRLKARLPLIDGTVKVVQGVREREESNKVTVENYGKLVLIGRHISDVPFKESLFDEVINQSNQKT